MRIKMTCCRSHFIENFNCIINDAIKESVGANYKLIEENNIGSGKVHEMEIGGNISNVAFTLDKRVTDDKKNEIDMLAFLNKSTGDIRKKNDLIIICPKNNNQTLDLTIFIVELKSDNPKGAGSQILCGYIFVKYLLDIYKLHYDCNFDIKESYCGIISSSKYPNPRFVSTQQNKKYNFFPIKKNGYEIPSLCWNPSAKLPLNDIHKSISCL